MRRIATRGASAARSLTGHQAQRNVSGTVVPAARFGTGLWHAPSRATATRAAAATAAASAFAPTPAGLALTSGRVRSLSSKVGDSLRSLMRKVPQPVVVVTVCDTAKPEASTRGLTCSSFTSVSMDPPIVSFAIRTPSSTSALLHKSSVFAVHLLSKQQIAHSVAFSSPKTQADLSPFSHHLDDGGTGLPILHGCLSVLICHAEHSVQVGDHEVWFGRIERIVHGLGSSRGDSKMEPLLYYESTYRSIGDEVFMDAFEQATLSFDEWTHRSHLRMAWIYLSEAGANVDKVFPVVKEGIMRFNAANQERVRTGFNETITQFFLRMTAMAIEADLQAAAASTAPTGKEPNRASKKSGGDFLEFLARYPLLDDFSFISRFYSRDRLYSNEAKSAFIEPDLRELPSSVNELK
ncbi:flavin reductase like domain-containing protein [Entophlyctis helioformis]|nr:flavin reductase like domain-containing protein [Entophlyctis helioformis]